MGEPWQWWALILGLGLGAGIYWLVRERLPRSEDDLDAVEQAAEARWISGIVGRMGGDAPPEVVGLVLELHREYLHERLPAEIEEAGSESGAEVAGEAAAEPEPKAAAQPEPRPAAQPEPNTPTNAGAWSGSATTTKRSPERPASGGSAMGPAQ